MDKIKDSGSLDMGSIPVRVTLDTFLNFFNIFPVLFAFMYMTLL